MPCFTTWAMVIYVYENIWCRLCLGIWMPPQTSSSFLRLVIDVLLYAHSLSIYLPSASNTTVLALPALLLLKSLVHTYVHPCVQTASKIWELATEDNSIAVRHSSQAKSTMVNSRYTNYTFLYADSQVCSGKRESFLCLSRPVKHRSLAIARVDSIWKRDFGGLQDEDIKCIQWAKRTKNVPITQKNIQT